ncbi:MAG TPA: hypothetical protein VMI31_01340, partial [Fimbriimonadaceae bacterium]|nr:hypothetical protein [Fimbriimonadaceae bacterium]
DPNKPDPLLMFVKKTDDMKAGKPYEYDPLIMASRNRIESQVTVLKPQKRATLQSPVSRSACLNSSPSHARGPKRPELQPQCSDPGALPQTWR